MYAIRSYYAPEGSGITLEETVLCDHVQMVFHPAVFARMLGYALVTPLFEELFIRSFVMRYAEVYGTPRNNFV